MKKLLVVLLIICPILIGCGEDEKAKKKTTPSPSGIFKTITNDNLTYKNTSFEKDKQGYQIITEVENKGQTPRPVSSIYITFKDKNDNILETITSYVGEVIKPNDSIVTVAKTEFDLSQAVSADYSAD